MRDVSGGSIRGSVARAGRARERGGGTGWGTVRSWWWGGGERWWRGGGAWKG